MAMVTVLLIATFIGQFDFFVVNVAAPTLRHDLAVGDVTLELVVGGYAFSYAAGLITGGRLGDLYGHRRMYIVGICGFAMTSLFCGLASNGGELVLGRMAQGLAAAMMLPQVLGLITATLPPEERSRATGLYGVASGLGGIAGQVLGGVLVTWDMVGLGWRTIFLVNVPVALVAALLALRILPEQQTTSRSRLDLTGAFGFASSLAMLLVPLTLGQTVHWAWWTWSLMATALLSGVLTLRWEESLGRRGGSPILEARLLQMPSFRAGLATNFAFLLYFASYMFTLTLFTQLGLGLNPLQAGLVFTPTAVLYMTTALFGHQLVARWGVRPIVCGSLLTASSLIAVAVLVHSAGSATSPLGLTLIAAAMGPGNGLTLPSLIGAALVEVPAEHAGSAAGALATVQQFAASSGVAVLGTVYLTAAGASGGPFGQPRGMVWATAIEAALVLGVAALVWRGARRTTRVERRPS